MVYLPSHFEDDDFMEPEKNKHLELAEKYDRDIVPAFAHLASARAKTMAGVYQKMVMEKIGLDLSVFARNMEFKDDDITEICRRIILNAIYDVSHVSPRKKR